MKTITVLWILAAYLWVPSYDEQDALEVWIQYFEEIGCDNLQVRWDCVAAYPWPPYWWCPDFHYFCTVYRHRHPIDDDADSSGWDLPF